MAENQTFSDIIDGLTPGMVVDANGEIAVIVDILRSQFTETVCLFVRFSRNVGNARPYCGNGRYDFLWAPWQS